MARKARIDPSARVEKPVRPWPMVHPIAVTPPKPISWPPITWLAVSSGSFAYALASRSFRWEGFAGAEDTATHVMGGLLMGFGGVTAMGCTIGQGLTGFSTLALGSILAFLAIVAGSALTMKVQYWRMTRAA